MKGSVACLVYLGSMGLFWWTAKRMARLLDRPHLWDAADGVVGALTGILFYPISLPLMVFDGSQGISTSPELLALRNAAALALGMTIAFVYLSMFVEKHLDWQEVPASLEPIEDRVWDNQMCWTFWSPDDGWRGPTRASVTKLVANRGRRT